MVCPNDPAKRRRVPAGAIRRAHSTFKPRAASDPLAREGNDQARDSLLLTVVPGGRPAGARPMIATIELVRQ